MEKINDVINCCKRVEYLDLIISLAPNELKPTYLNNLLLEFQFIDKLLIEVERELDSILKKEDGKIVNFDIFRLKREIEELKNDLKSMV